VTLLIVWWVIILTGLIASGLFLVLHRPRNWFRPASLNATGWVIIIFLLYARSVVGLVTKGDTLLSQTWTQNAWGMIIGIAIDVLLVFRVYTFLRFQKTHEPHLNWVGKKHDTPGPTVQSRGEG
jgi:hypothetical protein